jgi:hypothetical protein
VAGPGEVTLHTLAELGEASAEYHLAYASQELLSQIPEAALQRAMARGLTLSRLAALQDRMGLSVQIPEQEALELVGQGLEAVALTAREADGAGVWPEVSPRAEREARGWQPAPGLLYGGAEPAGEPGEGLWEFAPVAPMGGPEGLVDLVLLGEAAEVEGLFPADALAPELPDVVRRILAGTTQLGPGLRERARRNYYGGAPPGTPPVAPTYYYHVIPEYKGYLVLQYWFFYAYNDWGTGHGGINDHEGDWEGVVLFLRDEDSPEYVAYSRHIRLPPVPSRPWLLSPDVRRWDDGDLERLYGYHPVVRVGCGSHASYVERKSHVMGLRGVLYAEDHALDNQLRIGPGQRFRWERRIDLAGEPWSHFAGRWGVLERGLRRWGTASPQGPRSKARWTDPVTWAWIPDEQE